MALTTAQLQALKALIVSDPVLNAQPMNSDGADFIAKELAKPATPDFWVWLTNVSRADLYHKPSPAGSSWNWNTYKAQSVTEQNAWVQMFMGDFADFSLANLRSGVAAIFQGSQAQNDQRDHCLAVGRRAANRAEMA